MEIIKSKYKSDELKKMSEKWAEINRSLIKDSIVQAIVSILFGVTYVVAMSFCAFPISLLVSFGFAMLLATFVYLFNRKKSKKKDQKLWFLCNQLPLNECIGLLEIGETIAEHIEQDPSVQILCQDDEVMVVRDEDAGRLNLLQVFYLKEGQVLMKKVVKEDVLDFSVLDDWINRYFELASAHMVW